MPIITNSIITSTGILNKAYQIEVSKKKMIFNSEKKVFSYIPYPVKDSIGFY